MTTVDLQDLPDLAVIVDVPDQDLTLGALTLGTDEQVVQLADVGVPGPPGNTAAAEALVNALAALAAVVVRTTNPTTARPEAPFVLWLGGTTEPNHMADQDLWAPDTTS